jgi:hypothetical protein
MKRHWLSTLVLLLSGFTPFALVNCRAQAPATGAVEFVAHVRPTDGRPEPVRQLSFYLLRESVADIREEVERAEPAADMDKFIDGLEASAELKAWMKKHRTVDFVGTDFIKQLTADDVINVPEFFSAYKTQNGVALGVGIPEPKFKPGDQQKNAEKYQREHDEYVAAMRRYIEANRDSLDGLDAALSDKNPGRRWAQLIAEHQQRIQRRVFELAQTHYLAAMVDSDLDGRGVLTGIAPGAYWITNLDTPALAGDTRLRWDLGVTVRAGETARVELSNLNALDTPEQTMR